MNQTPTTYESCADTAKRVRAALKARWPAFKFSVRSKTYSGGASISVHWEDGPDAKEVESVAKRFEGATFDGMVDLKSYVHEDVVNADGSVSRLHFGSDFVFCTREMSAATEAKLHEELKAVFWPFANGARIPVFVAESGEFGLIVGSSEYPETLIWQAFCRRGSIA